MTTITFHVVVDGTEQRHEWTGDRDEAIWAAEDAIGAKRCQDGTGDYLYFDDSTQTTQRVSGHEIVRLGAALLSGHSISDAYSIWCAHNDSVDEAA